MQTNQEKRESRRKQTGEDFTPSSLVNEILDRLSTESHNTVWAKDKIFCDPACGNGNFLIEVLKRKLNKKHDPVQAISTIYGADIMKDNIKECRLRLLKVILNFTNEKLSSKNPKHIQIIQLLCKNIKHVGLDKYANGSLDYDFEFRDNLPEITAKQAINNIIENKLLDTVSISEDSKDSKDKFEDAANDVLEQLA